MRNFAAAAIVFALIAPCAAQARNAYGPKEGMFGEGYKEKPLKDGTWKIETSYSGRMVDFALNVALYRAAELARESGHSFVQILEGSARSSGYIANGYLVVRPTDSPLAPADCRRVCYTADVGAVMSGLSGMSGNEPGMPTPTTTDHLGRAVAASGFGVGAVAWTKR